MFETIEKLKDVGKSIFKFIKNGLIDAMKLNVNISKRIINWIKGGGIFDLVKDCNKLGMDMCKGIIAGMLEIAPQSVAVGMEIIKSISEFMWIGSPSKRMKKEIGYWMGAGIAEGITQGYEENNPMKQLNADIQASASQLQSTINTSLDLNNNIQGLAGAVVEGIENSNLTVKIGEREMGRVVRSY